MKKIVAFLLTFVMLFTMVACSSASGSNPTTVPKPSGDASGAISEGSDGKEPIIVGFLGRSSGPDALYGLVPQYLMEDYVEKINAEGGWNGHMIDFRPYDISGTGGDFSEAVNATNKLIQEGAQAILGPSNSAQGTAVAELCNKAGILHIPSSAAQLVTVAEDGTVRDYTYRCGPMNEDLVVAVASYAYHELNQPRVAILYETTLVDCVAMRDAFVKAYEGYGGEIVDEATYQVEDMEFRAQLTKLAQSDPDYIFMPAMAYKEVGNVAKQLSELGYAGDIKLLGTSVYDAAELSDIAGKELEGCVFGTNGDLDDPRFDDIKASYEANHGDSGMSVHMAGLISFNALKILEYAVLETDSVEPDTLRSALDEATEIELFTGPSQGYDPATHNLKGLEFVMKEFTSEGVENLGTYVAE